MDSGTSARCDESESSLRVEGFAARLRAAKEALEERFFLCGDPSLGSDPFFAPEPELAEVKLGLRNGRLAVVGRTTPALAQALGRLPGARAQRALELVIDADELEEFSRAAHDVGLSQGWRNEALDLFDLNEATTSLARLERALFRPLGALTRSVHLVGLTREPRSPLDRVFLLSKRSKRKTIGPGLWDSLAAGMVAAGETPLKALYRESREEAGLTSAGMEARGAKLLNRAMISRPVTGGWMHEASYFFRVLLAENFKPEALDGEVERFGSFSALEALEIVERKEMMLEAALALVMAIERSIALVEPNLKNRFEDRFV